ncbi:MAG: insulinase family protein, partial [Bacteroidales bacterium]|nr:insulinase family protein [Bacteroidales bacterium]
MKKMLSLAAALLCFAAAFAQGLQPLPNDPEVKTGKLDNGMTYYIRHNPLPAGRAEFYLATHVGAIQETPDQDGLAHFLEHMCFNGLKNLPGKQMLEYLQHIGAEFGRNINASTGAERTQYMLNNIPLHREGVLDTCLLVMHDYSHFVVNDPAEIDAERGVILEEKRTRNNAGWRMNEKSKPYLYGDSKYAGCTIIGSEENLKTFRPESLKSFYETWYRPDMQALIIVGDIDVDQVYNKVVKLFSDIPAPVNPKEKVMPKVEVNKEPLVGILADPENTSTEVEFIWKMGEPTPNEVNGTIAGYVERLVKRIVRGVMYERFNDISSKADAPFLGASFGIFNLCETMEACYGSVSCENAKVLPAVRAFCTEIEKMKRFGFSDSEIARVKEDIIKSLKDAVSAAPTRKNPSFIRPLINHFCSGVSYLAPETELKIAEQLCGRLDAKAVNAMLPQLFSDESLTIIYSGIDKPDQVHPTEAQLLSIVGEVKASTDIKANAVENISSDFMAGRKIKSGKVRKTSTGLYGSTRWTLSNGLEVVVLHTEYKKDQVIFDLVKKGGTSLVAVEDFDSFNASVLGQFFANSGVGEFSSSTVSKMLSGKNVGIEPYVSEARNGVAGSCSPEDFETAMQMLNLVFTSPRFDPEEWNVGINQLKAVIPNAMTTPSYAFSKQINNTVYADNGRKHLIDMDVIGNANLETVRKYYGRLFGDVTGATLYVVGKISPETVKPLVEKYCGSISKARKASDWDRNGLSVYAPGNVENVFTAKMKTPKVSVRMFASADTGCSVERSVRLDAAKFILRMVYTTTLREEEGGTYGASVAASAIDEPVGKSVLQVGFDTNVEKQEALRALALKGLRDLAANGPTEEQMTRARENAKKNIPAKRITNTNRKNALVYGDRHAVDYDAE